jgi:hypothetical protein
MPDPRSGITFFTLDEAQAILPKVRQQLALLREIRARIVAQQAKVDIEELTAGGAGPDARRIQDLLAAIDADVQAFHKALEAFQALGCELKDLERGLVDFYSMRGNEVVFLCWMDGEENIAWWHPLDSGVKGRRPIDGLNAGS